MTPAVRKAKAKQLAGLIEQLDIAEILRHRLAMMMIESHGVSQWAKFSDMATLQSEFMMLINNIAMEGPLKYGGTEHKLREPAE
jgi:hypothetical protein